MMEIDWSKAPEGAVAALTTKPDNVHHPSTSFVKEFFRFGCTIRGVACSDGRALCAIDDCWDLIERPLPEWNGEGLPPAGTVCEWFDPACERWLVVSIAYLSSWVIVLRDSNPHPDGSVEIAQEISSHSGSNPLFRIIRTPEQIAAEERLNRVRAIESIMLVGQQNAMTITEIADLIDRAGYRKQEES